MHPSAHMSNDKLVSFGEAQGLRTPVGRRAGIGRRKGSEVAHKVEKWDIDGTLVDEGGGE